MNKLLLKSIIERKNKYLGLLLMALIVAIFSFPEIGLDYNIGIDLPLKWLYNHLFSEGLSMGKNIIFPHGPLAFFMYPLANNFILSVVVTVILQVVFVFQLFFLFDKEKWQYWLLTALLSWFIFSISNFNQFIISNVSIAYLLFLKNEKPSSKYWGLVLTAFAFYIKAYVAIITLTLTFSLLAIDFIRNKNYKRTIIDSSILLIAMLLLWWLIYLQPSGFINYIIGMIHLADDNSAAAGFHPNNNWLLVVPFLLVIWVLPFLQKNKEGLLFGFLFLLGFFAAWKYGMAREDNSHVLTYLIFIVVSMILFLVYNSKMQIVNFPVILVAVVLFGMNMKNVEYTQPLAMNYSGIGNFIKFVSSYSEIRQTTERQNLENISRNCLPEAVRNQIGKATVDIYPWDYTILAANQLNWRPRPVIQSYAAYTSWLDKKNADHFAGNDAPEYFVFGLNNTTYDLNGGKLASIDNRYLLNDEPQTMIELIKNYDQFFYNENFLVYRKRNQPNVFHSEITKSQTAGWHQWIVVPDSANHFTRLKLHLDRSFMGKIKSFLFKDELYYVYFKTSDGSLLKYRIVPQNAADGIWISPFYTSVGNHSPAKMIKKVSVLCSDKFMVEKSFSYEWEYFDIEAKTMNNFFGKDSISVPEIYVNENFNVESERPNWEGFIAKNATDDLLEHQKYYQVEPESFSPAFKLNTDSLPKQPMRISVDCWLKTERRAHSNVVIETENAAGEKNWQGVEINRQIIDQDELNHISSFIDLKLPIVKVTVYIWNNGKKPVMIYAMNIKMIRNTPSGI